MEDNSVSVAQDSSNEDLPEVDLTPTKAKGFQVSSIVWVKWRSEYWPALVRQVYKKKVTIVFADLPCDNRGKEYKITVPIARVAKLDGSARSKQLYEAGMKGCEELRNAIDKSLKYVIKHGLGSLRVPPVEFLQNPNGNVLAKYRLSKSESNDKSVKRKLDIEFSNDAGDDDDDDDDVRGKRPHVEPKPESDDGLEDSSEAEFTPFYIAVVHPNRTKDQEEFSNAILTAIRTKECLDYLQKVFNGSMNNTRHRWFTCGTPSEQRQLRFVKFDHILTEHELEEVINFLRREMGKRTNASRYQVLNYTLDVWVPEALIFALQTVLRVSKERAEASLITGKLPQTEDCNGDV